jgi:hypothetical protein
MSMVRWTESTAAAQRGSPVSLNRGRRHLDQRLRLKM